MPITMTGIGDLAKTQKLILAEAPPRGRQKCYRLLSIDKFTEISVRCKLDSEAVENIAVSVPGAGVPRYAIKRNAFIMTALLRAATPDWTEGYNWLVDNMRRLSRNDRISHAEKGVTVSLDRWTRGVIRMTIGGL